MVLIFHNTALIVLFTSWDYVSWSWRSKSC